MEKQKSLKNEELQTEKEWQETSNLDETEIMRILAEYRRQQLHEHMIGPIASFIIHIVALLLLSIYVVSKPKVEVLPIEVSIEKMEVKPIEQKMVEEIEQIDDEVIDSAPEMSVPDVPSAEENDSAIKDVNDEAPESNDNMDMEKVLDVVPHSTPLKMPGLYGGRTARGRTSMLRKYGGTKSGQNAVLKALRWLAKVQNCNGSWMNNPAHTGMALLCFLAHGETPLSEEFGITVQKAMQWLANGMPTNGKRWSRAYSHGIATYALSEAYGMTQIPFLRAAMEAGVNVILKGQQKEGGFNYNYAKGKRWDMSVSGWQMQALKAAFVSGSTNPDLEKGIEKAIHFCRKIAYKNGTFGYASPGGSRTLTGTGALCLQLMGEKKCKEAMKASQWVVENRIKGLAKAKKDWKLADRALYGWYYDTQAAFQRQGSDWKKWRKVFEPTLIKNQNKAGYWETTGHIGGNNTAGRVLSTTFSCLQLEVYYRYLPTFKFSKEKFIKNADEISDDDDSKLIIE